MIDATRAMVMMMGGRLSNTVAETINEKQEGVGAGEGCVEDEQEEVLQRKIKLVTTMEGGRDDKLVVIRFSPCDCQFQRNCSPTVFICSMVEIMIVGVRTTVCQTRERVD